MKSANCRALKRLSILTAVLASAMALQGCQTTPSARIEVGPALRAPCFKPTSPMRTQADADALTIDLASALRKCGEDKDRVVRLVDEFNEAMADKSWWPLW